MKNKVLFALLICFGTFMSASAQVIPNYSFETWVTNTNYLDLTITTPHTLDTTVSQDPSNWTTSNGVTDGNVFHHKALVTQSANSYVGSSAIQLTSDSLTGVLTGVPIFGTLPLNFVCPGFAVSGHFPINLSSFLGQSGTFNPALLPGAGVPVSGRYAKIAGYLKYSPVGGDSAYVVAVLRHGSTLVAQAVYTRSTTDASYTYFEAPFVYVNCLEPDTMVYTLSSGNPYSISGVIAQSPSGLHKGSTLLADTVFLIDTVPGFAVAVPVNDVAQTLINTAVAIPVTTNDISCTGGNFILSQSVAPKHGSITISGNSITYTPSTNFLGLDTFVYGEAVGNGPVGTAQVVVTVACGVATPRNDTAVTTKNTTVPILVTSNDSSCAAGVYTLTQSIAPRHGTITIHGDTIFYTPDSAYLGLDTFSYSETIGGGPSGTAVVLVYVNHPAGINDIAEGRTSIYPNPASNKLHIVTSNSSVSELRIYDMLGKLMKSENFSSEVTVDVSSFNNGLYIIQFSGSEGKMISSSRFTVIK